MCVFVCVHTRIRIQVYVYDVQVHSLHQSLKLRENFTVTVMTYDVPSSSKSGRLHSESDLTSTNFLQKEPETDRKRGTR